MATFLTTKGTEAEVENIFRYAKERIAIITPYLKLGHTVFDRLKDAGDRGIIINLVYKEEDLHPNEQSLIAQINNLKVGYLHNLHAKAYLNESSAIITSQNLYEAIHQTSNREMGVLLTKSADAEAYADACNEVTSIIRASEPQFFTNGAPEKASTYTTKPSTEKQTFIRGSFSDGYCIRCGEKQPFNPGAPLCRACYSVWADFGDADYPERRCHRCGRQSDVSMRRPECYECFCS